MGFLPEVVGAEYRGGHRIHLAFPLVAGVPVQRAPVELPQAAERGHGMREAMNQLDELVASLVG